MKKVCRKFLGRCIGLFFVLTGKRARCVRKYDKEGTVLSFFTHNPDPGILEGILKWLVKQGFSFLSTDELLDMRDGRIPWRRRIAWLTFDDGWAGFEENFLPILERYDCAATIFVPPREIDRGQVWTNSIRSARHDMNDLYFLSSDERYRMVDEILAEIGNPRRLMTSDELKRISKHPLITLENHTYTHMSCSSRPIDEMLNEVQLTQAVLTDLTGRVPRMCCYPFGHSSAETDRALCRAGLIPVQLTPGVMTLQTIGAIRNMFNEKMTVIENIGRVLGAWVKVKPPKPRTMVK